MGCKELKEGGNLRHIFFEETGKKRMDWAYKKKKEKTPHNVKGPIPKKAPCKNSHWRQILCDSGCFEYCSSLRGIETAKLF